MRVSLSTHRNTAHIATIRRDNDVGDNCRKPSSHITHKCLSLMGAVSLHRMHLSCQSLHMDIDLIYQHLHDSQLEHG